MGQRNAKDSNDVETGTENARQRKVMHLQYLGGD